VITAQAQRPAKTEGASSSRAPAAEARPLAGSFHVVAPLGGVLVFIADIGQELHKGDTVAEVIDPLSGQVTPLLSPVDGLFYARESRRLAVAGMRVAKVAGNVALRTGPLLSA
jgi:predicted deacylase